MGAVTTDADAKKLAANLIRLLLGHLRGEPGLARMLLGAATDPLTILCLLHQGTGLVALVERLCRAHRAVLRLGGRDPLARAVFRYQASRLGVELSEIGRIPALAEEVAAARRYLERISNSVARFTGTAVARRLPRTWWDRLFELAKNEPELAPILARFNDASIRAGQVLNLDLPADAFKLRQAEAVAELAARGEELARAVGKAARNARDRQLPTRIRGVVRRMAQIPPARTEGSIERFLVAVDQLAPTDPVRASVAALAAAFEREPIFVQEIERTLGTIEDVCGQANQRRLPVLPRKQRELVTGELEALARSLTDRVQGQVGEMAALASRAYRDLVAEAEKDAARAARELNSAAISGARGWAVRRVRRVRAPAGERNTMSLYYDDLVVIVREGADGEMGEAHIFLATEVKSGDSSSQQIVAQVVRGIEREAAALIELDGVPYRILTSGVEAPVRRVFVGTVLPSTAKAQQLPAEIIPLIHRADPDHFQQLAQGLVGALLP
jgi:hypothetical protein